MPMDREATAILLAGGKSSRFGRDKTMVDCGGRPLAAQLALRLKEEFKEVLLITNQENKFALPGIRELGDIYPGQGPLAGIHAGLLAAGCEACLVAAADMPFINVEAAAFLMSRERDWDAVVPTVSGRPEPLFAVYHRNLAPLAESLILRGQLAVREFLSRIRVCYVPEEVLSQACPAAGKDLFYNINYPGDYERIKGGDADAVGEK